MTVEDDADAGDVRARGEGLAARRRVALGFVALVVFVALGVVLEGLHAFKVAGYLGADQGTRRLLLRLGHAHGGVLSIVQIAYGLTTARYPDVASPLASSSFALALALVPAGFLLGAVDASASDPGALVLLVPPGALALVFGLVLVARRLIAPPR